MRTASDVVQEIESLSDDLGELEWTRLAAIRSEVRSRALTDEVFRELKTLEFIYQDRYEDDYEAEVVLAVKEGLDPAAHLTWLLKRRARCAEIAHFLD